VTARSAKQTIFLPLLIALLGGCSKEHVVPADATRAPETTRMDQTIIPKEMAEEGGIRTARVGSGRIRDAHEVQGLLTPVEGRHARIHARFPGPVVAVRVGVGESVKAGRVLAVVESNASLTRYDVTAPFAGTILDVAVGTGDRAADQPLFELADLSTLWVDLHLFGGDAQHITPGLPVQIIRLSDGATIDTKLDRILPGTATASQSTVARATIANIDGRWRPGTAVRARVTVAQREAALIVPNTALQAFENATVVFTQAGETYTARRVRVGERDSDNTEVLEGIQAGDLIVIEQSYLVKSDLEKSSVADED
jgi:cobalt-zinc-cadmium efflux system membrane fusion protein